MSEPFLAEIKMIGFTFAPRGWSLCDGQILPINQYQSLYSLLGTTYGGDGRTSFALPELRGRTPIHKGNASSSGGTNHALGQKSGQETHTLTVGEIPAHNHVLQGSTAAATAFTPVGNVLAAVDATFGNAYGAADNLVSMNAGALEAAGGSQAHENMQPYLAVKFCIALQGLFPSRN